MKKGEKAIFVLQSHKAYGPSGFPAWGYPFLTSWFVDIIWILQEVVEDVRYFLFSLTVLTIPENAPLQFEIELLKINNK